MSDAPLTVIYHRAVTPGSSRDTYPTGYREGYESGLAAARVGAADEVARLRERLAEVVDYAVEVEVYDPDTGPYKTMAVSHETIEAARLALAAQPQEVA